ncbi:MAG: YtxH domain-containing protein [Phaeodactylibacter sp.]|nr:YtxH domain-containing protein [Phaeodactylibacter sp.]
MENRKRNNALLLALGAAAGAAAGWWLNTDKGRRFRKDSAEKINRWGEEMSEKASEKVADIKDGVQQTLSKGQDLVSQAGDAIKSKINVFANSAADTVDEAEKKFQNGVQKAKNEMS